MPVYQVRFEEKVVKQLNKLDRPQKVLLLNWIKENLEGCTNPFQVNNAKALAGVKNGVRYRVGRYRILATIHEKYLEIRVFQIGHRSSVYKHSS